MINRSHESQLLYYVDGSLLCKLREINRHLISQLHPFSLFRRVRLIFSSPENATTAKLIVQHLSFNGQQLKAFFAHVSFSLIFDLSPNYEGPCKKVVVSPSPLNLGWMGPK